MEEEGICCMMEEIDYLTLEKALSCADKKLRDRFRKNLPEKMRQEISYRWWTKEDYWNYYGCDTEERRKAMKRMICMAGDYRFPLGWMDVPDKIDDDFVDGT